MSFRHAFPVLFYSLLAAYASADDALNLDPSKIGSHKSFGPPPVVAPPKIMSYQPENQFDPHRPQYVYAADAVDDSMKPGHVLLGQMGNHTYGGAFWRQREANYYLIGGVHYTKARHYRDGNGDKVDFGYQRDGEAAVIGWVPGAAADVRLTLLRDNILDDRQPQHPMDPVKTRRLVGKIDARLGKPDDSNTLHLSLAHIDLKRRANNHDLRVSPPGKPKIDMKVEREKTNFDLNYSFDFNEKNRILAGVRYKNDQHIGRRFMQTPKGSVLNAFRFPDVHSDLWGVYGGYRFRFDEHNKLETALTYEHKESEAKAAGHSFAPLPVPSPRQLWMKYYGRMFTGKVKNDGVSGKIRYTWENNEKTKIYGEYANLLRLPENPESFSALPGKMGMGNVTNPFIRPERHQRFTLGTDWRGKSYRDYQQTMEDDYLSSWRVSASVFYDQVSDFITFDRARGQKGIMASDGTVITRNVDARLAGGDVRYRHNWSSKVSTVMGLGYRYGENRSDHRPLYQVRPFHADIAIDRKDYFSKGTWSIGTALRYEHKQTRRDDDRKTGLGMDLPEAAKSHVVADVYGSIEWKNTVGLNFGINNIFNRHYASFITNAHVEALTPGLIYAPGRTYWLNVHANF